MGNDEEWSILKESATAAYTWTAKKLRMGEEKTDAAYWRTRSYLE